MGKDARVDDDTFTCVAAGSLVLTKERLRPIETLCVGDQIISVNEETSAIEISPIVFIKKATREVGSIELNGKTLCMTSDHPVYDPEEGIYAPAGDWFSGKRNTLAMFADQKLANHEVEERSMFVKMSEVFDLTVASDYHNFIAEGILVHNKQPPRDMNPPWDMNPPRPDRAILTQTIPIPIQPNPFTTIVEIPAQMEFVPGPMAP